MNKIAGKSGKMMLKNITYPTLLTDAGRKQYGSPVGDSFPVHRRN